MESEKMSLATESSGGRWRSGIWESGQGRGNECLWDGGGGETEEAGAETERRDEGGRGEEETGWGFSFVL